MLTRLGMRISPSVVTRTFVTSARWEKPINSITVIGAGLMGSGIIQVAAQSGVNVNVYDPAPGAIDRSKGIIEKSLSRVAKKKFGEADSAEKTAFYDSVFKNIKPAESEEAAVADTDFVIEAIVENLEVKQKLFAGLDKIAPKDALFATNTSSLAVRDIFATTPESRQISGFHFFNPVPAMKLVEVIQADRTSDESRDSLLDLAKRLGKVPVKCRDTPGFIVNRLLVPLLLDALRMVDRGDASIEDIDIAMKLGAGYPMGPSELADFVGLDTLKHISDGWREQRVDTGEIPSTLVEPVGILEELVKEGKFGRKSGAGLLGSYK